jgi:hypothetical protein
MARRPEETEELVPLSIDRRTPVASASEAGVVGGPVPDRAGLDRSGRALGLGALLLGLVVAGGLTGIGGERRREASFAAPVEAPHAAPRAGDEAAPEGWRRGAPGPLRHRDFAAQVWTGTELVVWGGDPDGDSGAAYDPAADRWRAIAPAPIPARCEASSAWTGREVLVWGRACRLSPGPSPGRSRYATAGAAYDPAADRWRVLPGAPITAGSPTMSVWTGGEWVIANPIGPGAALEPTSGRWRTLPELPRPYAFIVGQWTGREVVVLGIEVLEKGPSTVGASYRHWAAALEPAGDRWRALPPPPLELAATAVWDGRRLIAWDQNLHASVLDPAAGPWQALPDVPVAFIDCTPQGARLGDAVFAEECGRGALFRPATGTWERVPHPQSLAEAPVWTGQEALFWVGRFDGSADGVWLYRP